MPNLYKKPFIIANWKMNHGFESTDIWLDKFFRAFYSNREKFDNLTFVICPSTILLDYIDSEVMDEGLEQLEDIIAKRKQTLSRLTDEEIDKILIEEKIIKIGGQDCHYELSGSFTGNTSLLNLKEVGCEFVIIGHSERREFNAEDNQIIAKKLNLAISQKFMPILCIGENLAVRNKKEHINFVQEQLKEALSMLDSNQSFELLIAYEPIWSIGSGNVPTILEIKEISDAIIATINELKSQNKIANNANVSVLYGGSVNSKNSASILAIDNIDGLLIGKASLEADEFVEIALSHQASAKQIR